MSPLRHRPGIPRMSNVDQLDMRFRGWDCYNSHVG